MVELLRFLGLFADLGDDEVVGDLRVVLNYLPGRRLVPDEADLVGVHEIVPVRQVDGVPLGFDPDDLVDDLVPPLLAHLVGEVELRVEDPDEYEPLLGEPLDSEVHDLLVAHGVVVEVELGVRKHEGRVISLAALDSPGRVHQDDVEVSELFDEEVKIEVLEVRVDVAPVLDVLLIVDLQRLVVECEVAHFVEVPSRLLGDLEFLSGFFWDLRRREGERARVIRVLD